jgi:hypothetical protein
LVLFECPRVSVLARGSGKDKCGLLREAGLQKTLGSSEKEQLGLRVGSVKGARQKRPRR